MDYEKNNYATFTLIVTTSHKTHYYYDTHQHLLFQYIFHSKMSKKKVGYENKQKKVLPSFQHQYYHQTRLYTITPLLSILLLLLYYAITIL